MFPCHRHPWLYFATLVILLIIHCALCYPATIARGHPALDPFWKEIAIYLSFLGVVFPPVFDDFSYNIRTRINALVLFAISASLILTIALTNLSSARPHVGYHSGYLGVLEFGRIEIMINTIIRSVVVIPFVICFESVSQGFWNLIRKFPPGQHRENSMSPE